MGLSFKRKLILIADTPSEETGLIYQRSELSDVVDEYKGKQIFGFFPECDPNDATRRVISAENLRLEGNALVCDFKILDTPYGGFLTSMIINHTMSLGAVGIGAVDSNNVVHNYKLTSLVIRLSS